ncbi:hypothetical protein ACFQZE_03995 [Paenibacillus sp. GCM10027627]|uniref:hypothetical protein n=1 Tax=unclassified Paenibacillus TaxID=185978 RepID=UPI00363BC58C
MNRSRWIGGWLALIVLAGMFLWSPKPVYACDCAIPTDVQEEKLNHDAVFEGTVAGYKKPGKLFNKSTADKATWTFNVHQVWKGKVASTIAVKSALHSASCGYQFKEGDRYLVYARKTGDSLEVSLCSRTTLISSAGQDLAILGAGTVPPAQPSTVSGGSAVIAWIVTVLIVIALSFIVLVKIKGGKTALFKLRK